MDPFSCPVNTVSSKGPHNIAVTLDSGIGILKIGSALDILLSAFRTSIIYNSQDEDLLLSVEYAAWLPENEKLQVLTDAWAGIEPISLPSSKSHNLKTNWMNFNCIK